MTKVKDSRTIERTNPSSAATKFGVESSAQIGLKAPGLLDVQRESFDAFLSFVETDDDGNSGLKAFLEAELNAIKAEIERLLGKDLESVHISKIYVDRASESAAMEEECLRHGRTYEMPVRVNEHPQKSGGGDIAFSIPMMTPRGTFIVNGQEKVVLSQLVRSPGVTFEWERGDAGELVFAGGKPKLKSVNIVTEDGKGPWLKFEVEGGRLWFSVWKKEPAPAAAFFKAFGIHLSAEGLKGTVLEEDIALEKSWVMAMIGRPPSDDELDQARAEAFYRYLNRGKTASNVEIEEFISSFLFDQDKYLIGGIGRDSLSRKLGARADVPGDDRMALNKSDLERIVDCVAHPENYLDPENYPASPVFDIPEQLSEKRVRRCGDFLKKALLEALRSQFRRMRIEEEESGIEGVSLMAAFYDGRHRVTREIRSDFKDNSLLQVVDQCNPLSGLTQKRRLSCFGPGGLSSKNTPEEARLVERSHYGRICPIETPEGQKVGVVTSLALYAKVDGETGAIKSPFRILQDGERSWEADGDIAWLSAAEEDDETAFIAEATICTEADSVSCRAPRVNSAHPEKRDRYGLPNERPQADAKLMDAAKGQLFSISGSLIPFVDHDDGHRALMGSNMQRQAIPLLYPDAPYVGTGLEGRVAAECGDIPLAEEAGTVVYADAKRVAYKTDGGKINEVHLPSLTRTNKGGTINLRPLVRKGNKVSKGQVLADGYATDCGELALGANLLAAYMCWEGYNYEDGIVLSQRVLDEDILTSVHTHEYDVELRDTNFKTKGADGKVQRLRERVQTGAEGRFGYAGRNLTAEGLVRIGAKVGPGDVLVAKATFEAKREQSNVDSFLDAVKRGDLLSADFVGNLARRECKLVYRPFTVPDGIRGTVIGVDRKPSSDYGVNEIITVRIAQTRKVEIGDKLAGRHGNKGVISKILPAYEMPFLADGTPVDIILNPLGVPSRLNVGQLFECALGWVAKCGEKAGLDGEPKPLRFACPPFDGPSKDDIDHLINEASNRLEAQFPNPSFAPVMKDGKVDLYDGRTGRKFEAPVAVGYAYMMKLDHMVQDKMHARSTGSYSQIERQPLKGRSNNGGQRLGDMEGWAVEAYGASELLHEMFTAKSDSKRARHDMEALAIVGQASSDGEERKRLPESTEAFLMYLRALCLKPVYSEEDSTFSLGYARKRDMQKEGGNGGEPSDGSGSWPSSSIVREFRLLDFTHTNPKPVEGGLLDELIFGACGGSDGADVEGRRTRMGHIELSVDDKHPIYHPWFLSKRKMRLIDGKPATIEWLPVLPAGLRPVTEMNGGFYTCSDLNVLYRNVILHNDIVRELRKLKEELEDSYEIGGSESEALNAIFFNEGEATGTGDLIGQGMRALQLAVNQLIDNGHCDIEAKDKKGRAYDSLTDKISGKSGIIRKCLLGKRVDYSGRSVIAPDPKLAFEECGLPYEMAKELFRLQLIKAWLEDGECHGDERQAKQRIDSLSDMCRKKNEAKLKDILANHLVLLNRAPTLHRMGIQAYRPVLTSKDEKAIRLHPLACSGFNADFDGDTMAVFAPVGEEACSEARELMLAPLNILSPANGKPIAAPSQDMVIGLYFETATQPDRDKLFRQIWEGEPWPWEDEVSSKVRKDLDNAVSKFWEQVSKIKEREDASTTVDEILMSVTIVDRLDKKKCAEYVGKICRAFTRMGLQVSDAAPVLNGLMWLGFKYATVSGLTVSYADLMLSEQERAWISNFEKEDGSCPTNNPILEIAESGARGKPKQIRQVVLERGLMEGSYGEEIESPINNSLADGMDPNEYWITVYSSRRKVMDTALGTAISGELARTMVNAVQDVVVTRDDCGTNEGRIFELAAEMKDDELEGLIGRYLAVEVSVASETYGPGTCIESIRFLRELIKGGVRSIVVRSPLACRERNGDTRGVCGKCCGWDLSKHRDSKVGAAVGIVAAQSLSEPATQLTLSSFHGGGAAGSGITEGLPRIKELLYARKLGDMDNLDRLEIAEHIIGELKKQLEPKGIDVNDRHFELIASEMLRDVSAPVREVGKEGEAGPIRGIGYLAKHPHEREGNPESGSFLGAAAVEGARSVLAKAICSADDGVAVDHLVGLKENLILGRRVPVGTGYKRTASAVAENPEV